MFPLISDIRRYALDDGPGIRTTIFFKGCPLSCVWCHNPESMNPQAEIAFYPNRCIGCGDCAKACPEGAVKLDSGERLDRKICLGCGRCAEQCHSLALKKVGRYYTVAELLEILKRDRIFYDTSGGGVTFSGGEPMLYMEYAGEVMKRLKDADIHVAIETSGYFDLSVFKEKVLPYADLILYDIKFIDQDLHKRYTGRGNQRILCNFDHLLREDSLTVIPGIPFIPGITAVPENLTRIAGFLKESGCNTYRLLPYNPGGILKRRITGREIPEGLPDCMPEIKEDMELYLEPGLLINGFEPGQR